MAGRLHLRNRSDHGLWDPARISYSDEQTVDLILTRMEIRKVRTVEELDELLSASRGRSGSIDLYVHEDSLGEARRRWEEMRAALSGG